MRTVDPESWWPKQPKPGRARSYRRSGVGVGVGVGTVAGVGVGTVAGAGLEARLRASLRDAARELVRHTSVQGLRRIADTDASMSSRLFYALLMSCLVAGGTWAMACGGLELARQSPLQMEAQAQAPAAAPPAAAAFPAIALCSNCIVRKRALAAYTEYLVSKVKNSTYSRWQIKKNLMEFGALFTVSRKPQDLQFMRFLYSIEPNFNVTDLMYKRRLPSHCCMSWRGGQLSPRCSGWLRRCAWRGHAVECERLFAARATPLGFCCVFNSRYHPVDVHQPPKVLDLVGPNFGLAVLVTEDLEDVAYTRRPTDGFDVLIFDGMEYPLLETGAARLLPVSREEAVYFPLRTNTQLPSATLNRYSEKWRRCRIKQPGSAASARRSYAWCLVECRRRTSAALCGCLPIALLPNASELVCTPEHLHCLNKHREKLLYYYPGDGAQGLDEELQDSQQCLHCLKDCARVRHVVAPFRVPFVYPNKLFRNLFSSGISLKNTTELRFYYDSISHEVFTVAVNMRWFETLAMAGCQARAVLGLSLAACAELLFHLGLRWPRHFLRRSPALVARWRRFLHHLKRSCSD